MTGLDLFTLCVAAAITGISAWLALVMTGFVVAVLREWLDDFEKRYQNPTLALLGRLWGYRYNPNARCLPYERTNASDDDGDGITLRGMGLAAVLAPMTVLSYHQPAIPLALAAITITLFTARFVKRLKKKFDLHAADKNAHP